MNKWNKELMVFLLLWVSCLFIIILVVFFVQDEEALKITMPIEILPTAAGFWAVLHKQNKDKEK